MRIGRVYPVLVCFALTCNYVSAWFKTIPEKSPVVVAVGDTAVLRCHTSITNELKETRWIRIQDGRYSIINIFKDGRDQQRSDLPEYTRRTEVMIDGLARGRVALKLFNVSVADEGTYCCFLQTVYYFDFGDLKLKATALGSDSRIDIEGSEDGGIKAVCRSAGWYPEPTIVNKGDGGVMETRKEANGLYSVEYSRVISENSNRTFSCLIRSPFPGQEREASLYIRDWSAFLPVDPCPVSMGPCNADILCVCGRFVCTDDLFRRSTDTGVLIIIYPLIVALLLLLLLLLAVVKLITRARQRNKQDGTPGASDENIHLNAAYRPSVVRTDKR